MVFSGDSFRAGESLCVASIGDVTVGINVPQDGVVTRILRHEGFQEVKAGEAIAIYAVDKERMMAYMESERLALQDAEKMAAAEDVFEEKAKRPDTKLLLRHIRHLISEGLIQEGSGI